MTLVLGADMLPITGTRPATSSTTVSMAVSFCSSSRAANSPGGPGGPYAVYAALDQVVDEAAQRTRVHRLVAVQRREDRDDYPMQAIICHRPSSPVAGQYLTPPPMAGMKCTSLFSPTLSSNPRAETSPSMATEMFGLIL